MVAMLGENERVRGRPLQAHLSEEKQCAFQEINLLKNVPESTKLYLIITS